MNQHKRYSFFGAICVSFFFFSTEREKEYEDGVDGKGNIYRKNS